MAAELEDPQSWQGNTTPLQYLQSASYALSTCLGLICPEQPRLYLMGEYKGLKAKKRACDGLGRRMGSQGNLRRQ